MSSSIQSEARLTFWEATSLIVGHGVGAGILSVPYLASRGSLWDLVWILAVVYVINLLLHFMIAELSLNNKGAQFIRCFQTELFRGRLGGIFTWAAFALLGFSVIVNISGFLTGAAAVLASWLGLPRTAGILLFYLLASAVVFAGMKLVGICEKLAVISMTVVIAVLAVATVRAGVQPFQINFVSAGNTLALYSMVSFALSAVMSVPQVVKGLDGDIPKIKGAIAAGTGINLALVAVIALITLAGTGGQISQNGALVDLSERLGGWVGVIGYLFSLLALATSFWANALNLRDIVTEQTNVSRHVAFAAATLPSLALALLGLTSFVGFTRMASVVQVLTGVGVIVAYHLSRRRAGESPLCGRVGTLPFQLLVIVASVLSTVGALLPIR